MFKNINSFYPNDIFPRLNFSKIKSDLKNLDLWTQSSSIEDFGSILVVESDSYYVTVNNIGTIEIYYDSIDTVYMNNIINEIEFIFREQANNFSIKKIKQ